MPANITIPEVENFRLEELDKRLGVSTEEKTTVDIKQGTVWENSKRSKLFSTIKTEIYQDKNTETRIYDLPFYSLILEEIYLTLVGCNLTVGKKAELLFKFAQSPRGPYLDMNRRQFDDAVGLLDDETLSEIHEKVLEVNPHWSWLAGDLNLGEDG